MNNLLKIMFIYSKVNEFSICFSLISNAMFVEIFKSKIMNYKGQNYHPHCLVEPLNSAPSYMFILLFREYSFTVL